MSYLQTAFSVRDHLTNQTIKSNNILDTLSIYFNLHLSSFILSKISELKILDLNW